jgi:hypothetical protein
VGPRVAEGADGGETPEVFAHGWLALAHRDEERLPKQSLRLLANLDEPARIAATKTGGRVTAE